MVGEGGALLGQRAGRFLLDARLGGKICSIVILNRLCLLKKVISCGHFFANGLKPCLY